MRKDERITILEVVGVIEDVTMKLTNKPSKDTIGECIYDLEAIRAVLMLNTALLSSDDANVCDTKID